MTSLEDAIGRAAQSTTLTPAEKAAGRRLLRAAIGLGPTLGTFRLTDGERAEGRAVLHDAIMNDGAPATGHSMLGRLTSIVRLPAVAMGLMLSTGLAVAANNALPGDSLYPVKIAVLEPVIGSLQPTSSLRAAWSVEVLHRRLWEIDEITTRTDDDNAARLEVAEREVRAQAERVLNQAKELPLENSQELRTQAQRVMKVSSDSVRRMISTSSNDSQRVSLQTLLSTLENHGHALSEDSDGGARASAESSTSMVRPLPGGVGVSDPAIITITIGGDDQSDDVSSENDDTPASDQPESSISSRSQSISPRPPNPPTEPVVPPPARASSSDASASTSSATSASLSLPAIDLPAIPLGR